MSVSASVSSEMAAQSTFSYAQAAKGQGTVPSNTTPNSTAQAEDSEVPPPAVKSATSEADQPESVEAPAPASPETSEVKPATSEKQEVESIQGSEGDAKPESVQERRPESRREEEVGKLDRPWRRNDKGTRSSSTTTRSDDQDSRRARRGKKGKAAEKQSGEQATAEKEQEAEPEPPKVELFEAPIPSVNIWHQRQQAKGPSTTEAAVNGAAGQLDENKPLAKSTEETTPSGTRDVPHVNGVKSQRKPVEPTRTERNGPRGSRLADKDSRAAALPAVEDASSWPTPETSIKEAAKDEKRKTTDRSDRSDKDSQEDGVGGQSKKGKDKWVTYDYVPTVSFETQLPQMRNSKPRGGARTGRESGPRASAESLPGKATPTAPSNKSTGSGDRSREVNGSHRATSQPPAAKRASLDNSREQKKAAGQTCSDKGKDVTAPALENGQAAQTRPEGRNDRGRGGYRGRGAHHAVNSQAQHQQPGPQGFAGQNGSRPHGHYSPPPRQGAHSGMYMPPTQRGRGGRNNNFHRMSMPNTTSRGPAVQTQFGAYDYNMAPMSAYQPAPFYDGMLVAMLKGQIEYYFSIENLCKDMYLRQRMDSQGFVPLHFVAGFKRIRDLSVDMNLIRAVCEDSTVIEYIVGDDDGERLRSREAWQKFVLPMADRDELARNDGPAQFTYKNRSYGYAPQFNGIPPMAYGMPTAYSPNPNDPAFQQFVDTNNLEQGGDAAVNGNGATQLSAEVPDFSPSNSVTFGADAEALKASKPEAASGLTNGHVEAPLTNGLTNGVHAEEKATAQL